MDYSIPKNLVMAIVVFLINSYGLERQNKKIYAMFSDNFWD